MIGKKEAMISSAAAQDRWRKERNALAEVSTFGLVDIDVKCHIMAVAVSFEDRLLGLVRIFGSVWRLLLPVVLALVLLVVLVLLIRFTRSLLVVVVVV